MAFTAFVGSATREGQGGIVHEVHATVAQDVAYRMADWLTQNAFDNTDIIVSYRKITVEEVGNAVGNSSGKMGG